MITHAPTRTSRANTANPRLSQAIIAALLSAALALVISPVSPAQAATAVTALRSGNWSDPSAWVEGRVPGAGDSVVLPAPVTITYDVASTQVAGVTVSAGATLSFAPSKTVTLASSANVVVNGKLSMRPASAAFTHTLRFVGVNEAAFVGGGMDPVASDVGLWIMGAGQLDVAGSTRTGWTRAAGSIPAGATTVTLQTVPTGWAVGDEVSIAPTESPAAGAVSQTGFDLRTITAISGATVTLNAPTTRPHPQVNGTWTAEVLNLTRNVRIEGTEAGRSHIFIRSSSPQAISHVAIRYMGPRKMGAEGFTVFVAGRYGIHFHHSGDGSRGSVVQGTVIRDTNSHAYAPHTSHGITIRDAIAYNVVEDAFWWDPGEDTHDTVVEHAIAAQVRSIGRNYRLTGFFLAKGEGNVIRDSVAVGVLSKDAGGYFWDNGSEGVWEFSKDNRAHNNAGDGITVWQNSSRNHFVSGFASYHNSDWGIDHGAYSNSYRYSGATVYGNKSGAVLLRTTSKTTAKVRFEDMTMDAAGLSPNVVLTAHHPVVATTSVLFRNVTMRGSTGPSVRVASTVATKIDFVDSAVPAFYLDNTAAAAELVRVQNVGQAFTLARADQPGTLVPTWNARRNDIAPFAASSWGTGTGLKGEYFNNTDFTNLAVTRIDGLVEDTWTLSNPPHHTVTPSTYSIRWTGQVQAQYSEPYTFTVLAAGGLRLWVNDTLLIDRWADHYPAEDKGSITLTPGQRYNIRLEYFETVGDRAGATLQWSGPKQVKEIIPQSQLYAT